MRGPGILTRYIAREVLAYTLLGLAAISVMMLARNLVRVLDDLLGAGFSWADLWMLARLLGVMLLQYALPVSFLFGVLLAIGRMAGDVEVIAMRACGIGMRRLVVPITAIGLLISALTLWLAIEIEPAARREMRGAVAGLVARGAGLEPGRFRRFGDVLVYVDARGGDRVQGVVVSDRRDPERPVIVFASEGHLSVDPGSTELTLALERGDIHLDHSDHGDQRDIRISFDRFDYSVDLSTLLGDTPFVRAKEMSWTRLRNTVARIQSGEPIKLREENSEYELVMHRRIASPAAPALFGLVGLPIGMRRTRGARSWGALWCAVIAFVYYGLQTFFGFLCSEGWFSAAVALWLPNACFGALAGVLLARARRVGG